MLMARRNVGWLMEKSSFGKLGQPNLGCPWSMAYTIMLIFRIGIAKVSVWPNQRGVKMPPFHFSIDNDSPMYDDLLWATLIIAVKTKAKLVNTRLIGKGLVLTFDKDLNQSDIVKVLSQGMKYPWCPLSYIPLQRMMFWQLIRLRNGKTQWKPLADSLRFMVPWKSICH